MKSKGTPLTVRRCPPQVHQALKQSAQANHRSLNGETLHWLERQAAVEKPKPAREVAATLREFERMTTAAERKEIAKATEQVRQRHAHERLS